MPAIAACSVAFGTSLAISPSGTISKPKGRFPPEKML
jgi:hypothetical protein